MKNTYKIILGSAFAIAIIGGAYVNRPRIEVTAEATANATSTVIVPTSTKTIVTPTTTADVATSAPQITYVIKETVREVQAPTKPVEVIGSAGSMIDNAPVYVPTPIFTTPTVIVNPTPVIISQPIQEPTPAPKPEPVIEPTVEPEAPFFSEYPRYWIEERVNGRWIFFQATWSDGSNGKIVCNGRAQESNVRSGLPSIVEEKNLADQITGGSLIAEGRYVSCTFTVGSYGGVTANITVK